MRILNVFIDMLRTDLLNLYNNDLKLTPIDSFFRDLGGTTYTNVYTPSPDTFRSISSFWSGLPSYENGCNSRHKFPSVFLNKKSFLESLTQKDYSIRFLSDRTYLFPPTYQNGDYYIKEITDINQFNDKDNLYLLIDLPDIHFVLDDYGYSKKAVIHSHSQLRRSLEYLKSQVQLNSFDYVLFFSDHGHILNIDSELIDKELFMGVPRSRIFFHTFEPKKEIIHSFNYDFLSITSFYEFILELTSGNGTINSLRNKINLKPVNEILIEDFLTINNLIGINSVPNIWCLKTNNSSIVFDCSNYNGLIKFDNYIKANSLMDHFPHLSNIFLELLTYNNYLINVKNIYGNSKWFIHKYYFDGEKRKNHIKSRTAIRNFIGSLIPPILLDKLKCILKSHARD
jgi:hypothetical protein